MANKEQEMLSMDDLTEIFKFAQYIYSSDPYAGKVRNGEYTLPGQQVYLLSCTFGSIGAVGRTGKEVAVGFNPAVAFLGLGLQVFEQGAVHRRMLLCRKGMSCSYAVH